MNNNNNKGFTLIEMMVAVSLFVIVALITTGALVTASAVNRKAQAIKLAMDNTGFAMDSMVSNLREGASFGCDDNMSGSPASNSSYLNEGCTPGQAIIFDSKRGSTAEELIIYRYQPSDSEGPGRIQVAHGNSSVYTNITAKEVEITKLSFYVPHTKGTGEKPRATIVVKGQVPGKTTTYFNVQTVVKANF